MPKVIAPSFADPATFFYVFCTSVVLTNGHMQTRLATIN
jgi:hypothetical protein